MTEAEWLASADPTGMLAALGDAVSHRKLRLFMAACCRRVWHALDDEDYRQAAVVVAERFADGLASAEELADQFGELTDGCPTRVWDDCVNATVADFAEFDAISCAQAEVHETTLAAYSENYDRKEEVERSEARSQARLLRCVFGNPFRAVRFTSAWRTADVTALAEAAYHRRRMPAGTLQPSRLAVLADALEEAGGTSPELLAHLRERGPHVRGCWAIDLALARA
jgi:hypothetical protein